MLRKIQFFVGAALASISSWASALTTNDLPVEFNSALSNMTEYGELYIKSTYPTIRALMVVGLGIAGMYLIYKVIRGLVKRG